MREGASPTRAAGLTGGPYPAPANAGDGRQAERMRRVDWLNAWDRVVKAVALVAGAVSGLFGGFDTIMWVLVGFMALDYLSGLIVAWMGRSRKTETGHLDSKVGAQGIAKKGLMLLVVLVAALLDRAMDAGTSVFRNAVIWFYLANEGLSILENMSLAGVPFPQRVQQALEQLRDRNNETPEEEEMPRKVDSKE